MVNSGLVFRFSEIEIICGEAAELLSAPEGVCSMQLVKPTLSPFIGVWSKCANECFDGFTCWATQ